MTEPIIRSAVEADLESIRRIYEHDVLTGTASFEIDPPDLETIRTRWQLAGEADLPYLVAMIENQVVAFAYALPYRPRPPTAIPWNTLSTLIGPGAAGVSASSCWIASWNSSQDAAFVRSSASSETVPMRLLSWLTRAPGFIRWARCRTWAESLIAGWTQ